MVLAPTNAVNFMNAMDKLSSLDGIFIKQVILVNYIFI